MYNRVTSDGDLFQFSPDSENFADYVEHGNASAHADGFQLVFKRRLEDFEGIAFGRGQSENPDKAEAYAWLDLQNDSAAAVTDGHAEIVVLNSADEVLAPIYRRPLDELAKGDPSTDTRGDWGVPLPYQQLNEGKGEVIGDDYQIGLRVRLNSGTETLSVSNSSARIEGYSGRKQN